MKTRTKRQKYVKTIVIALLLSLLMISVGIVAYATDTAAGVLSGVATKAPTVSADGKSIIPPAVPEGYVISINGTSNESVIDIDGNVYTPLVDTTVKVNYKVTKTEDGTSAVDQYKEASVVIKGKYDIEASDNKEPAVLPKLREWKGGVGTVSVTNASRIVVSHSAFMPQAELIGEYIADIMGAPLEIVTGESSQGDIVIGYTDAKELGQEGYTVELSDRVTILAYSATGALYGGTTVAQMLTLYEGYELPKGYIRDYPAYEVRASMVDVARHYIPLEYLTEMSKYLAYFKVNQIHVHINDNGGQQATAFRVESKRYPAINSKLGDNIYSQEDYRAYQTELLRYGVKVITEIDSPGHAGFAKFYDPSLVINNDYLDLTNNYDGNITFMKGLIDEFLNGFEGNPPIIIDEIDTIHLGMDEYTLDHDKYKEYMTELCDYASSLGKKIQLWSALKTADFAEELPISPENITINYWGDADLKAYAEAGFHGVSNYPAKLYIVPTGTTYFSDAVDVVSLYDSYEANIVSEKLTFAESSPLLLGVEGALWNDKNSGVSKEGIFNRLRDQMLLVSEKAWYGKAEGVSGEQFEERLRTLQNLVPKLNPQSFVPSNEDGVIAEYDFGNVENGKVKDIANNLDATVNGLSVNKVGENSVLTLDGEGYLSLPIEQIGFPYTVSFGLTYSSTTSGILFSGGDTTFWLNKNGDGRITFTRELHNYRFDFVLSKNAHYDITLLCTSHNISLFIDGVYIEDAHVVSMNAEEQRRLYQVLLSESLLPTARIGEGIVGALDSLKILGSADKDAYTGFDKIGYGNLALGKTATASGTEVNYKWGPENAVDGITQGAEFKVSLHRKDNAWLVIDLERVYAVDEIKIYFVQAPEAYKLLVSQDGVNYTEIHDEPAANATKGYLDSIKLPAAVGARYIKYQQVKMFTLDNGASYSGGFVEIEVYGSEIALDKNLALGKEVIECTPNEKNTTGVPQDLTDGNNVASWTNRVCFQNLDEVYFTVDLGSECLINGINLYWQQKANKYQVYVSSDRSNWTLAYEDLKDNGGVSVTDHVSIPGAVIGRYVKVVLTECFEASGGALYCGNLAEVEVMGTETNITALNTVDAYLKTLSGDAKTHLYNRIALVKRIINTGNTELSAFAIKLLCDEYERMLTSSHILDTETNDIYNTLFDVKSRKHASSDTRYDDYELAYKLALSAYINSRSTADARSDRLSRVKKATLTIAIPDSVTSTFEFADINALIDGNQGNYLTPTDSQSVGESITINYNNPITFASIRYVVKDNGSAFGKATIEISHDGTTFRALKEIDSTGNTRDMVVGYEWKDLCELVLTHPIDNVVAIRVTITAATTKALKLSEIIVNENVDLNVLIPFASDYSLERYLERSIYPFSSYYKSEAVTRAYINNAESYITFMIPKGDTKEISAKISNLKALDTALYTDASVSTLNTAITAAEALVSSFNSNVSVYDSDEVLAALTDAENALVRKIELNTLALEAAIASANVNSWEYTYYTYNTLSDAISYGKALLSNANATQAMIDEAYARVSFAVASLEARTARTNVALNKSLIISGREVANKLGPELAVDGDKSTRFSPNTDDGAYFIVDLGESFIIDSIEVYWASTPRKYKIDISTDNVNYVTVYEALDTEVFSKSTTDIINLDESVQARYVKFDLVARFPNNYDKHWHYNGSPWEVMIYSADMSPSKSELQYFVDLYNGGIAQSFAPECKAKIEAALANAQSVLDSDSATAEEIETLVKLLKHDTDALGFAFADEQMHSHTCPCGVIISGEHSFDEGSVILAPTAFEEGQKLYTCSVCGGTKTENIPTVDLYLYSMRLNLAESVNVVFIAEVKEGLTNPYLVVKLLDKEYKLTRYTVREDGRYEFVFRGATPANMTDVMNATLYAKSGDKTVDSEERSFTIRDYCSAILSTYSAEVRLRNLISDTLVYGAALQKYVGHKTNDLATSSVPRLTSSTYDETITDKLLISGTADGNKWIGANLVCTGRMSVDFTFECVSPEDTVVKITVCGRDNTYKVSEIDCDSDGRYSVRLNGIMAYEFDETITAEFIKNGEAVGETLSYSVNSYIVYMNELYASSTDETEAKLVELVRAISCYGNSAKAYYNAVIGGK